MENVKNLLIGVGALAALFLWLGPALGQEKPPVSPSAGSGQIRTVEPPAVSGSAELTVEAPAEPSAVSPSTGLPRAESRGSGQGLRTEGSGLSPQHSSLNTERRKERVWHVDCNRDTGTSFVDR